MRYKFTDQKMDKRLKQKVLKPTIYPKIPLRDDDIYMYPADLERCEHLAFKFYGDQSLWWIIAQANNIFDGSIYLDTSKQIRVPVNISGVMIDLENINRLF